MTMYKSSATSRKLRSLGSQSKRYGAFGRKHSQGEGQWTF